ncbi:MAG: DUF4235 domain-containing protein [Solirubrobacteraceae bacterium]|nr:DUF4235 domain-containing protein [Solirubrobacteraceae bacterium]
MIANLIFKPIGVLVGIVVGGKVGNRAFEGFWAHRYGTEAPTATTERASWPQVLGAAALRASLVAVTVAALSRAAASGFRHVTGFWPGEERPKPASRIEPRAR